MARKRPHYLTRDADDESGEPAERLLPSEARRQHKAFEDLAQRLAAMTTDQLEQLPLDDHLRDEIALLGRMGRQSARRRQQLRVMGLLRQTDLSQIEAGLDGSDHDVARLRFLERWRGRLIDGDDIELAAYMAAHPTADRQRLRSLIRQARKQGPVAKAAARKLFQLMKAVEPVEPMEPVAEE